MKENGTDADDMFIKLSDGTEKQLFEFWNSRILVLVFLRHFGWPFCREQVEQLRRKEAEINAAGAHVVLAGMGNPRETEVFRQRFQIVFPVICDPDRKLYNAYQLTRMGFLDFFSPSLALKSLSAMSRGHLMGLPEGNIHQLAGVFIIDTTGRIRFEHRSRDASDYPGADEILEELTRLQV